MTRHRDVKGRQPRLCHCSVPGHGTWCTVAHEGHGYRWKLQRAKWNRLWRREDSSLDYTDEQVAEMMNNALLDMYDVERGEV